MPQESTDPASAFTELGRIKLGETDLDGVLNRVADLARATLPGADEVSITLVRESGPQTAVATGEIALRLDRVQYGNRAGPCLDAAAGKTTVSVPDTTADSRWNDWPARADEAGVGSSLSVGLPILDTIDGAMNIYGRQKNAFDCATVRLAQTLAGYAGIALANAHLYDSKANLAQHMQAAMENRAVIEQAKGIIMGDRRCSADEAFAILTRISQDSNRKVRDVAAALVARTQRARPPVS
ncbi:GAF and ANTAR domain-containing protein [Paractinoplanes toevensis]|uniref:Transcriptional regulator n=1 Tax=Paractinoplanes toevensis TaxID=571911 RepID=A0A919WBN7_9ACTN|nr:GAF and ANTAR domain-containing protein [Actinoplanes toevensis]GIM97165.1 transcriptional regulator [Actinoplanes toevensis]